ncbi:uncharacterized protein LOC110706109 [Chenopodium quinoa]|uniref:uncharacterized protein LOC110706109 n=1 Tax=Chenopodium quinoa TaxID=63459 RepID=UPI000B795F84|nr:uncharacterized protein LOC110706109 [Chenopodium quinoa]
MTGLRNAHCGFVGDDLCVSCYYIDSELNAYAISSAQLYSNTPSDFDFKLESLAQGFRCLSDFMEHLAASVDIVFPVIHGPFGEDGTLQVLAFRDINPQAPVHILIIPKVKDGLTRLAKLDVHLWNYHAAVNSRVSLNPSPTMDINAAIGNEDMGGEMEFDITKTNTIATNVTVLCSASVLHSCRP